LNTKLKAERQTDFPFILSANFLRQHFFDFAGLKVLIFEFGGQPFGSVAASHKRSVISEDL
jgi:hypothetical protein